MKSKPTASRSRSAVDRAARSASADKAKGHTKEVIGSAREKLGGLVGNESLQARGRLQNADGKKDRLKGEIKGGLKNVKDKVKAGAKVVKDKFNGMRGR